MISHSNEQIIWNFLHKSRNGITVSELARKTGVSKPTVIKITNKFRDAGDITKPKFVRGKRSLMILIKFTEKDNFQRVKKTRNEFEKRVEKPIIIKTKKGDLVAGQIEKCEKGIVLISRGMQIQSNSNWVSLQNPITVFELEQIHSIYEPNYENLNLENVSLTDVCKLWVDSEHSIKKGIFCGWPNQNHSKECNSILHESTFVLFSNAVSNKTKSEKEKMKSSAALDNILSFILKKGEKIPYWNY